MMPDWTHLCRASRHTIEDGAIRVRLETGRRQTIKGEDRGDCILLTSVVTGAAVCRELTDVALSAWIRNRAVSLVGFRIDARGRLVGEMWVPKTGLTPEELDDLVDHIARECDRFEFQLTGADRE